MTKLTFSLPEELDQAITTAALKEGRKPANFVRFLLGQHFGIQTESSRREQQPRGKARRKNRKAA